MATSIVLFIGCLLSAISTVKSCSPVLVPDGEPEISNLQLLQDVDTVLLSIRTSGTSNYYCKEMDVTDGSVGDIISCDQDTRDFAEPDTDPTNINITSVISNGDGSATVTMTRNGQELVIDSLMYDKNVTAFSYFVLDDGYTAYITVSDAYYSNHLFAIQFESLSSNSNYTTFAVTSDGDLWYNFDVYSSFGVLVYANVKVIAFPQVCCLCDDYFVAKYEITVDEDNDIYNFSLVNIGNDATRIDITGGKAYTKGYTGIRVYDLETDENNYFEPDISSSSITSSHSGIDCVMSICLLLSFVFYMF